MTSKQKNIGPLTFGLDIGIASVGWAVLGENRIVDLGVRCFNKAETDTKGESLNLARRTARLTRRRLRRRAWRLTKLARLLKREGLIPDVNILKQQPGKGFKTSNLWKLRAEALDRKLDAEEWARVLYHLVKHRGFHWISRAEKKAAESDSKSEGGRVKDGLAKTEKLKEKYRTTAEMVWKEFFKPRIDENGETARTRKTNEEIFDGVARNKQGDYSKALSRELLADELKKLFEFQRSEKIGNPYATLELEKVILGNGDKKSGLFWAQKPALAGDKLLEMLGRCTFERTGAHDGKGEYRAPKASFTAERHVWLTLLNNLRIVVEGKTRPLEPEERRIALSLPYETGELKYGKLRNALVKGGLSDDFRFVGLAYPSKQQETEEKAKNPEDERLVKLPGWQELKKTLKDKGLETEWQKISVAALEGHPELLDQIIWVLSVYKEDGEVSDKLGALDLPNKDKMVGALLYVRFDKFSNLSLKALYKIVPLMEKGQRFDEAIENIPEYGHHSQLRDKEEGDKEQYLPSLYEQHRGNEPHNKNKMLFSERVERDIQGGIPRNPVVLRAINQARKVVNALIKTYGPPHEVHIEMARDLSRPLKERKNVEDAQKEFRDRNEKDKEQFEEQFGRKPKDNEFEKYRLYREQQGKSIYPAMSEDKGICAYSFVPIDLERLLEPGYVEIDHALPYRRSFDDSKNNHVLVLADENRNKRNMTPYEYLGGAENNQRWKQFEIYVNSNKIYRQAKRNRLLKKDFGEKEAEAFRERNLNDTRYICKFFKNYVECYLKLHDKSNSKRCVVLTGSLTSLLRARWGLPTSKQKREESDRHHAMDAVVVAACGHHVVKRLSTFVRAEGWVHKQNQETKVMEYVNVETGEVLSVQEFVRKDEVYKLFPRPWKHFRDELLARLNTDTHDELRAKLEPLGTYPPEELKKLRSLFVSRAPQRRNSGAAHKETVYRKPCYRDVLMLEDKEALKKAKKANSNSDEKILRQATVEEKQSMAVERIGVADKDNKGKYKFTMDKLDYIVDPDRNRRMIESLHQWIANRDERENAAKAIEAALGKGKEKRAPTEIENAELERLRALPRKPLKSDPDNGPFTGPVIRAVKINAGKTTGIPVRNGIATNDAMLRVDVFKSKNDNRFHLVPVYVHHSVKGLPNCAIVQGKDESEWTVMDDGYDFLFSLHPNDLVRVQQKGKEAITGYLSGSVCHRGTGNINMLAHDRNKKVGKDGSLDGIGIKTALNVEKFNVDVLGNIYPAPQEKRRDLA